ncbi:MAG: hypothetical protein EBU90_15260, partial [Proteobacteria bacterium]|nr:hypothetical protein [Pseudomonadota bacterium]
MANTVTLLNYANTFGDWIVTTNKLSQENNDLATNNYVKQAGTLFLNSPTLGLQVANNAVVQGQLQVSGIGSSTYLQTGLQVDGTARFTNTTISMSTSGIVYANGSANGVIVANNATVRGNVYAGLVYSGNAELQANDRLTLATAQSYTDTANSFLQANDRTTLTSAQSYTDTANTWLQANDRTTLTLAQSYTDTANSFLRANDRTTLTLAQNYTDTANSFLRANDRTTLTLAQSYTDTANSFLRANDRTTLTVSQNYTDSTNTWLQANDRSTLTLAQNYTDSLNSWTQSSISTGITTTRVTINSLFDANTATGYINQLSVGLGGLTVTGAFTISGATVYNTDTFTLNAGQTTGQNALFVNNRGSSGANAQIRWNEVQKYWDIRDVNNPTSYSQIVTANLISDSLTSTSSSTIASSRAANTIVSYFQGVSDTQNSAISAGNTFSRMAATTANTAITNVAAVNNFSWMASWTANSAWSSANAAIVLARAAYGEANAESDINITQNTWITNADILATAAYGKANAEGTINNTQNTWITNTNTKMEAAYATANINSGDIAAIESINITQNTNITNADSLARAAYGRANTSSNSFVGTTGTATPSTGSISFSSNNGITVYGSSNILNISTPQDLRSTASPTFAGLNLTTPLQLSQGGTSATSASGALTNLLPTGTTAGYVLTTGGPGNFYWSAAGGGGGGATPGTTINSTRLSYSGNSVVKIFTTPDFSQTTQLRAYINGVRQFESEYSVNVANSTIVFSTAPQTGDAILL